MRIRTAWKIIKSVEEFCDVSRFDMPYNGQQIYTAAKRLIPVAYRHRYKGWYRVTEAQSRAFMAILKGGKNDK